MNPIDPYALKNATTRQKALLTTALAACVTVLLCLQALTGVVADWASERLFSEFRWGEELSALFWSQPANFFLLFLLQSLGHAGLWLVARAILKKTALRRLLRTFLLRLASALAVSTVVAWAALPFSDAVRQVMGVWMTLTGTFLCALTLPGLAQMWFFTRWRPEDPDVRRVAVVGGGFAGLTAALGLDRALGYHPKLEITVVDRNNYFLFPPLLPSAAAGSIEARQVTTPFRRIFETTNIRFLKAPVTEIDPTTRRVRLQLHPGPRQQADLPYDYLILCPGSVTQTFRTPGADQHALFVRELSDAMAIRNRIIDHFERAAIERDPSRRRELLSFVVVGGGPTGVEIATEIHDLIRHILLKRYPEVDPTIPSVTIVQSGPRVLAGWPDDVVDRTTAQLRRIGVRLEMEARVAEVRADGVVLKDGRTLPSRTTLWCAGVRPSPLLANAGIPLDKSGRVCVDEFLRVPAQERLFVLGDAAACASGDGSLLPPLGQVAFQQGAHTAKNLVRLLQGRPPQPFRYFNFGSLVSAGERYAVVNLLGVKISGFPGWIIWRALYLVTPQSHE